jgi:hypothetical protein
MQNGMRLITTFALAALLGAAWGQKQTNITIQDGDGVGPGDTAVTPKNDETVSDQAYSPPDTASEVGAIPPGETKTMLRRKESKKFSAAGFGPAGFGNIDEKLPAYDIYVGRLWEVNPHAAIKALGEVASDFDRATMANFQLGANLYALPNDISPYIGGGLGLGYGMVPGDRAFGFNLGASVGALLFRTSNAQMNLEGSAQMMLSELEEDDGAPSVYSARLGVLF